MPTTGHRLNGTESDMSLLEKIFIECEGCGHSAELDRPAARRKLKQDLTHDIIPSLFNALKCSRCGEGRPRILDEHKLSLYHRAPRIAAPAPEILPCTACGRAIDAFRLAEMPGALLCASCEPGSKLGAHSPPYPQPPPGLSTCPRCNRSTVVRQRRDDSGYFIGCSSYPSCRWTTPLPADRN